MLLSIITNVIKTQNQLQCGPMPNMMVALRNIGGALCSTPQSLADAHYYSAAVMLPRRESRWNCRGALYLRTDLSC